MINLCSKQYAVAVLMLAAIAGCGDKKKTGNGVPVSGTVLYNGQPVGGALVTFRATFDSGFASTDEQGRFQLRTAQGNTLPPGDYQVTVVKTDDPPPRARSTPEEYRPPVPNAPPEAEPKDLLPIKYKDVITTDLKVTVTAEGSNDVELKLAE